MAKLSIRTLLPAIAVAATFIAAPALAGLDSRVRKARAEVDRFFEEVMVMTDEPLVRALSDPAGPVRAACAESLGGMGAWNAADQLIAIGPSVFTDGTVTSCETGSLAVSLSSRNCT